MNLPRGSNLAPALRRSERITARHYDRLAVVYVRQSTAQQVLDHQESTRLQYGLVTRAQGLGWARERILVIDDDLGQSGASAEARVGFQRLVSEVSLDHVGLVLGIEMSRLARSSKDWHQLLEICALFGTLIADLDGVYDPGQYNDRLLLGLKGTMSEAELHILKQRMQQGRLNKARRGELAVPVPIGYLRQPDGTVVLDPDEQVQHVVRLIFRKFAELGTLNAVLRYLVTHRIQLGVRRQERRGRGTLRWTAPNRMTLQNVLKNPIYAGAYAYGRRQSDPRGKRPGRPNTGRVVRTPDEWYVLLRDRYPAYIPWEQYERNLARLQANRARRRGGRGAPRASLVGGARGVRHVRASPARPLRWGRRPPRLRLSALAERLRRGALPADGGAGAGRARQPVGAERGRARRARPRPGRRRQRRAGARRPAAVVAATIGARGLRGRPRGPALPAGHVVGTNGYVHTFAVTLPLHRKATARYQRRDRRWASREAAS